MPLSSAAAEVDRAYRERLDALRTRVAALMGADFNQLDTADLRLAFAAFVEQNADVLAGSKAAAQLLLVAYLEDLARAQGVDFEPLPEDEAISTMTKAGTIADGFAGILILVLAAIGAGSPVDDAMAYGASLVERFADNETTAAADAETERQSRAADAIVGWEGLVSSGACAACVSANSGVHDLDVAIYRHPSCNCERVAVFEEAA